MDLSSSKIGVVPANAKPTKALIRKFVLDRNLRRLRKSTEPDGAASLPQITNPASAGCPPTRAFLWVVGRVAPRPPWIPIFVPRGAPPAGHENLTRKFRQPDSKIRYQRRRKIYGGRRRDTPYRRKTNPANTGCPRASYSPDGRTRRAATAHAPGGHGVDFHFQIPF
jgi:hypothetical protein